jgi:hypothetical protein
LAPDSNFLAFPEGLPFFLWFALSDANRARRIALANCLLDWEKPGFAMQIGAARNMKDFFVCILGDGYEPGNCRRIGRTRDALVFKSKQDNGFRRE